MRQPQLANCSDPLDLILQEHDTHQSWCNLLEEIADTLPDSVDQKKAHRAVEILKYDLPLHHSIEEKALFPVLMKYAASDDNVGEIVAHLNEEHVVDESFAEELIEFLEVLANGKLLEDANMFGYMLRGFFENYRRHIMWENSIVLPLARSRVTAEGLRELSSLIVEQQTHFRDTQLSHCSGNCKECKKKS